MHLVLVHTAVHALKNVNNCLNTNIYSHLETSGGQSSNPYLNVVYFINGSVNKTSVAAEDSCFPALVSYVYCSNVRTALSIVPPHRSTPKNRTFEIIPIFLQNLLFDLKKKKY
jgi:hypothetical protein